jgi:hypothetical protein
VALVELNLTADGRPLPADVVYFLREADRRIDRFQDCGSVTAFVPSDYAGAYTALRALATTGLARGNRFCEWGSGFGVVACLAAMLDFDASGIEAAGELVDEARRLADVFGLPVEFAHGSFVPPGAERRVYAAGEYAWMTTEADDAYAELGLDPDDLDVVFAYPWPDEEVITAELFDRYAGPGAILLTFHGGDGFRLRRKTARRARR